MKRGVLRGFRPALAGLWLAGWLALPATAAQVDGPYVMPGEHGRLEAWTVESTPDGMRRQVTPIKVGSKFSVPAVGEIPAFQVRLRSREQPAPQVVNTRANTPLLVVADTHGEYRIFAAMLMRQRVVDAGLRWSFGSGHLVILGDVLDRGPNQTEILWLLYQLQAAARQAGGGVHLVLGNHEVMNMRGDLRYLNGKYRRTAELFGVASYSQLFNETSVLGQWLRAQPVLLVIDDLLCVHGGISRELVDRGLTLAAINARMRDTLNRRGLDSAAERELADLLLGAAGPLWYRGYFPGHDGAETATEDDIRRIRAHFGVAAILVGHTQVPKITPLYGGQVIAVQVYPRLDDSGAAIFEALLIRDGAMLRARPDGGTEALRP